MNYTDYQNNHGADYCSEPAEDIVDRRDFVTWGNETLPLDLSINLEYSEDSVGYFKGLRIDFDSAKFDLAERLEKIDTLWTQLYNHGFRVYRDRLGDRNVLTCPLQIEETYDVYLVSTMLMELNHWKETKKYIRGTLEKISDILDELEFHDSADWIWSLCEKDIGSQEIFVRNINDDDTTDWKEIDSSIAYLLSYEIDESYENRKRAYSE